MQPRPLRSKEGPEAPIKRALVEVLQRRKWFVIITHGNAYQKGLPDLYCAHQAHGQRWVEVKYADKYEFTRDQLRIFPQMAGAGVGIWILSLPKGWHDAGCKEDDPRLEFEYRKLFDPPNYTQYLNRSSMR